MRAALKTAYFFGCFLVWKVARTFTRTPSVTVLMYHSVSEDKGKLTVSARMFAEQMAFLSKERNVVSLAEAIRHAKGEIALPEGSVAVTIDDGYLDTVTNALPILVASRIPATLFLTSDLSVRPELGSLPRPTWNDLRAALQSGMLAVGLHGHEHKHLKTIAGNPVAMKKEFADAADLIGRELGARADVYAYAYGERDSRGPEYLRTIGVKAAFGISDGIIAKGSDLFNLRRVQIDRTMPLSLFCLRTTGAVEIAFRIRKFLRR